MNRALSIVIGVSASIIALCVADHVRVYLSLTRQFSPVEINTVVLRCSPEHFYGRRIRVISEGVMQPYYACHDWRSDQWKLSPIPGASR